MLRVLTSVSSATALIAATALLAGCGEDASRGAASDSGSVGRGDSGSERRELPAAGEPQTKLERARADAQLKFARCMREQGLDYPDPRPNPDGTYVQEPPRDPAARAEYDRAGALCVKHLDAVRDVEMTPSERRELAEAIDRDRVVARCMRGKGYRWPDPIPSEGGFRGDEIEAAGIDAEDPAVDRDLRACMREAGHPLPPASG